MLIQITSARCVGIEALPVTVETSISNGIGIHLVGLADAAVKESLLRTTTALTAMGLKVPGRKIVINLAPADLHKRGSGFDLPIALGIIAASEQMHMPDLGNYVILGELGLDGEVRNVPGALSVVEMAGLTHRTGCILPLDAAYEALEYKKCPVYGVRNLREALMVVCRAEGYEELEIENIHHRLRRGRHASVMSGNVMDFSQIIGQDMAKRGLEIAAAGGHNVVMVGPPGSGKSSLAKAICKILPPMTMEEALTTSKIYSAAGKSCGHLQGMLQRPFRAPHNTISQAAMIGGGSDVINPGEVSLAHNGVLFTDEFCEMPRQTMELLRGPMEDKVVSISRLRGKVTFPADFMLIAATNPCPCGYYGEGDRCTCPVGKRENYLSKLSGPLMDRIDIQVWMHPVKPSEIMNGAKAESSAKVAERVMRARMIQRERFRGEEGVFCNASMNSSQIEKYCPLSRECREFLNNVMTRTGMSVRAYTRIIKLARTIADLQGPGTQIGVEHLGEAVSYRFLDKKEF